MLRQSWTLGAKEGLGFGAFEPSGALGWPITPSAALVEQLPRQSTLSRRAPLYFIRESGMRDESAPWIDRKTGSEERNLPRFPSQSRDGACQDFDPESRRSSALPCQLACRPGGGLGEVGRAGIRPGSICAPHPCTPSNTLQPQPHTPTRAQA